MKEQFYGAFFRITRTLARFFFPKYEIHLKEKVKGPAVYVSHHQNLFGPFFTMLWLPLNVHLWVLHVFLDRESCFRHYVDYTFTKRFGMHPFLAKLIALPLSGIIPNLLRSGKGIPVYRGSRKIIETLKISIEALRNEFSILIYPDIDYRDNSAMTKAMYDGFLYLEKYYYESTGQHLCFIPLYVSKKKKMILLDQPIQFRDGCDFHEERDVVSQKIREKLNELAKQCEDV